MPRYVLTGTPGAGKTAILRQLERDGFGVVEEAATDVIALEQALGCAEPWEEPGFTDAIAMLQQQRERAAPQDGIVFFDRSPVCTLALSRYSGRAPSALLTAEVERVVADRVFEPDVFFVRSQGFVTPTAARRISLADALRFEELHLDTYRELGFRLLDVPAGPLAERTDLVRRVVRLHPGGHGASQVSGSSLSGAAPADSSAPTRSAGRPRRLRGCRSRQPGVIIRLIPGSATGAD